MGYMDENSFRLIYMTIVQWMHRYLGELISEKYVNLTCRKFSQDNIMDISQDIMDISRDIMDISRDITDISRDITDISRDITDC